MWMLLNKASGDICCALDLAFFFETDVLHIISKKVEKRNKNQKMDTFVRGWEPTGC